MTPKITDDYDAAQVALMLADPEKNRLIGPYGVSQTLIALADYLTKKTPSKAEAA